MTLYTVTVRNERTGETTTVSQDAPTYRAAQELAAIACFKERGWSSALALNEGQ